MAFSFNTNNAVTTSWVAVFRLKALLKAVGWTVKSSGDGLSAFSSSGDVITGTGTGANGMANGNAWFRIQGPGGVREFVMQTSGSAGSWKVRYSAQSKFTGGSPSSTVAPTATDEQYLIGSAGAFASWMSSTENTYRWNACADAASPYGFWCAGFRSNAIDSTTYDGVLIMDPMVAGTYPAGDIDPVVLVANTSNLIFTSLITIGTQQRAWYNYGQTAASFQQVQAMQYGPGSPSNWVPSQAGGWMNANNKKFAFPLFWGRPTVSTPAPPTGWKGMSSLLKFNSAKLATGTAIGIATARDRICFGDINLPWDGSYPLL